MNNEKMIELVNYFHKAPYGKDMEFSKMNAKSAPLGYLIHPECCTKLVWDWLETLTEDYNATFYKEWTDVISKNRFELFIDQILHYSTTYGTYFTQEGNGYVPNDGSISPDFKTLKVIEPISNEDLYEKCLEILTSGIALKDKTMKVLCDFINEKKQIPFCKSFIESIKNREAQAYLSYISGTRPSDEFGLLRYLSYVYTGKCSLIKNKSTLLTIKSRAEENEKVLLSLEPSEMEKLSRIFKRFKPVFLAMKTKRTANIINRIRKISDRTHTPLKIGFWESLVSVPRSTEEILEKVEELDNLRKVRLIQCVNVALFSKETDKVYTIRNGKVFTRENYKPDYDQAYLLNVKDILENSLVKSLSKKACKVRIPEWFDIKLPSSEKSYVGNYPFGTSIRMTDSSIFGIFWKEDWGTRDFDLFVMDFKGNVISWFNDYYSKDKESIVFSGDMTSANPFATELLYIKKNCPDSVIRVNQYNGRPKSKFRFFVANEVPDMTKFKTQGFRETVGYMVDPNNIKMDVMIDVENEPQKTVGLIHDNTITLMDLHSGNSIYGRLNSHGLAYIHTMAERTKCFVDLKDILSRAGFDFVGKNEECDIDFNNIEKDTLINLMRD